MEFGRSGPQKTVEYDVFIDTFGLGSQRPCALGANAFTATLRATPFGPLFGCKTC